MCFVVLRHPSNLMLNRLSGKILHIDFGDCFEVCADARVLFLPVLFKWLAQNLFQSTSLSFAFLCVKVAMTREKFPEKIPFRLTRMLTNAMEVWIEE